MKLSLKPVHYTAPICLLLFGLVFLVPYLETGPAADGSGLIQPGHYPLIYLFLLSGVVVMDLFWGNFIIADWLWFLGFIGLLFLLYVIARGSAVLIGPRIDAFRRRRREKEDGWTAGTPDYIIDLGGKGQPRGTNR